MNRFKAILALVLGSIVAVPTVASAGPKAAIAKAAKKKAAKKKATAKAKATAARKAFVAKHGAIHKHPKARAEFAKHASRTTRLKRIQFLAAQKGDTKTVKRTQALLVRERTRHANAIERLKKG